MATTRIRAFRCSAPGAPLDWRKSRAPLTHYTHGPGVYFTSDRKYAEAYCLREGTVITEVEILGTLLLPSTSLVLADPDFLPPAPGVERLARIPEFQAIVAEMKHRLGGPPRWTVATTLHELLDELGVERFLQVMRKACIAGSRGSSGHLPEEFAIFDRRMIKVISQTPWKP